MPNDYTSQWFDVFLDTIPDAWTEAEIDGLMRRLPRPAFTKLLDICCGPGRHAEPLLDNGFDVAGVDRDADAIAAAQRLLPNGDFRVLDQRDIGSLDGGYDAALILWQSFGYFDPAANDQVLADVGALLRPGGRLLLDLFNPAYFRARQGRMTETRDPRCAVITNEMSDERLTSTIEYVDGSSESMEWELFEPDEIVNRAANVGFVEVERCCWWEEGRPPSVDEQRYQVVLSKP